MRTWRPIRSPPASRSAEGAWRIKVRLASDRDGTRIRDLLNPKVALDWSEVYPYWLVCEKEGEIVGCLSVCLGKPIGVLDQLALDPFLGNHARGRVFRALILQGIATLKANGTEACVSMIPFELKSYKRLLKKHFGSVVVGQGNIVMTRL